MLSGGLKAALLLHVEPEFDAASGAAAAKAINQCQMVVTMSPFKTNMSFSDVLLPIAPFTETSGTFVNAEARIQSFHAVVKPLGDTRPAWKVLRVLANLLGVSGFDEDSSQDVLKHALGADAAGATHVPAAKLGNQANATIDLVPSTGVPVTADIYQLDAMVRRATSLQLTLDGRVRLSNGETVA
jgi:NADH-quinone oxidoreductase subunit G